jgi:hypothetical protein
MTLSTCSPDNTPHAAAVYFVCVDKQALRLYFFSEEASQHGRDLAANPRAAVAIYPECYDWQDVRGLQMRGEAHPVAPGAEWEHAWQAYQDKFPFTIQLSKLVARNQLFVFSPEWIRLVDNRRGFGFKQEWTP